MPEMENVAAVVAPKVQVLPSVIVTTSVVDAAVAVQPDPANPVKSVTVGEAGKLGEKSVGHVATIVLPGIAVNAFVGVKPSVQVEVAPV
jgi:hypothetical protein